MSNELSIIQKYPKDRYTLLIPIETVAKVSEIQSPVVNAVTISTKLEDKEIYVQEKARDAWTDKQGVRHPATCAQYALTKRALTKLAEAAGIKQVESVPVLPSTCQKCAEVNRMSGKIVPCGQCRNKDVKYKVTVSVPQLTGETLYFTDHHEIDVETVTTTMSEKQKTEFVKHLAQICEAKALNGAIRTALQIKGTYTLDELRKPFVVAYLVPNLDNPDVKRVAIESMFNSARGLFGVQPKVVETKEDVPVAGVNHTAYDDVAYDEDVIEGYVDDQPYASNTHETYPTQNHEPDYQCFECGAEISERVYAYSIDNFNKPLCVKCQRGARRR